VDIGLSSGLTTYAVEFTPATSAVFYRNNIVVATITTNLPSGSAYSATPIEVCLKNFENLDGKQVSIGYWDFWQAN